jgi:hypothetical protein
LSSLLVAEVLDEVMTEGRFLFFASLSSDAVVPATDDEADDAVVSSDDEGEEEDEDEGEELLSLPDPSSAYATPAPATTAAPSPSVTAPAPSQACGSMRRRGARWRPPPDLPR